MNLKKNRRAPIILMAISLGLLALFEIFWLKSEYQNQEEWFEREQTHIFYTAIRSLEDSLFNEIALLPFEFPDNRFKFPPKDGARVIMYAAEDTSGLMMTMQEDKPFSRRNHSEMFKKRPRHLRPFLLGAFAIRLSEGQDSAFVAAQLTEMITRELARDTNALLLLDHELKVWKEADSVEYLEVKGSHYVDAWSKQSYAIVFADNTAFLIKRMWQQIVFSIFLFTCIAVAFSFIYSSLIKQWRLAALRTDFINNITHELKTPISTVRVALEAISNFSAANDPKRTKEYLAISQNELDRLNMLIDKVLQMSQLNEGLNELRIEKFDIEKLVSQTLTTMKVQFDSNSAEVRFDISGNNFEIDGDPLLLTGVIYNLLDNAMKYSPENPNIHVQLKEVNGDIELYVKDNGQGIPPAFKAKIFDQFFRVPTGDRHNTKGHGLGLSYVSEIVEQHHGKVSVTSEVGVGSEFKITLPKRHVD